MIRGKKYDVSGLLEAEFELGSRKQVLRNLLGIKNKREMDQKEAQDIHKIYKIWLGRIYGWAGEYRQVNISKGGFKFASAVHIPALMEELEKDALRKFTPCRFKSTEEIAEALAVVHIELVLVHPRRVNESDSGSIRLI